MKIKTTFKSHFKVSKSSQNKDKKNIFVKNIIIFILFSRVFFKGCDVTTKFNKSSHRTTNLLKAPSRHKQFFHQIFFEVFTTNIIFNFPGFGGHPIKNHEIVILFLRLNSIFLKIGSNVFSRVSFSVMFITNVPIFLQ